MLLLFKNLDGLDWTVIGEENIPAGPFIVASKHQSVWDTIFFTAYFSDAAMVLKKILIYIPAYGWHAIKAKMIWVDREAKGMALRYLLKEGKQCFIDKRPIVIFPEGTRVKIGEKGDYKTGCFALYKYLDIPCIPVALNSGLFWQSKGYRKSKGKIKVKFLKKIEPGLTKKDFNNILEERIETATNRLISDEKNN
ncbi:MAG: lysophospholipid acyltransferase family protein [Pseudomonadota bacterium]|nr:lysophospholipid acyltransferase family protein [Pseudomonadota bacterium]